MMVHNYFVLISEGIQALFKRISVYNKFNKRKEKEEIKLYKNAKCVYLERTRM